ncbi:hypothetical protein D3C86_387200 [compost metagenome]
MSQLQYERITSITNPLFPQMHQLMQEVFPDEEVLEFDLWKEPLEDPGIRVFVAIHDGEVVGTTEYRYYTNFNVAMTDFTIIGKPGLGIGRFLWKKRQDDLERLSQENGKELYGMFAEIYDPYRVKEHDFGGVKTMDPYVRREVLSHLGYKKLDLAYVHPSWNNDGEAVEGLDLGFMPADDSLDEVPASLVVDFLTRYYTVLPNKPKAWVDMIDRLKEKDTVSLLPL